MQINRNRERVRIERSIEKISALPITVDKVIEICSRIDASPNELNKVISLDPVLTGQVLKLINSAYYSLANKVTSLTRAITMLGMNTVKNMALSATIMNTMRGHQKNSVLLSSKFWTHSIATGAGAKLLGEMSGLGNLECEELFLAGLLHDLGKIPYGEEYREVINLVEKEQLTITEAEREVAGIDHQGVGALIAEKWRLNVGITNCIINHHNAEEVVSFGNSAKSVALVALGDFYTNVFDYGYAGNSYPEEENIEGLLKVAGVTNTQLCSLGSRVREEIIKAEIFLNV